jgi:chloramphenicol 3-O phosphotransferase
VTVDVIVLNGGSSSGKSTLAQFLQQDLSGTWLVLGVDDLIRALSFGPSDTSAGGTLRFGPDGSITVGHGFRRAESAWWNGMAAIAASGIGLILDEVFLNGAESQARLAEPLRGLTVVWVGIRCDPEVAQARERQRGDRIHGMASNQAERVHDGVRYDFIVDTTRSGPDECARDVLEYLSTHHS